MSVRPAARFSETAKASTAPSASSTRASATEVPTGPVTVAEFESGRPSSVQTAPAAPQSAVAGSDAVTSSDERGRTVIVHRWFWPCDTRFAPVTRPFVARSTL